MCIKQRNYRKQTSGALVLHAPISALQETKKVLKENNLDCFLKSCESSTKRQKNVNLPIYSWRTLKTYYRLMEEETLPKFSLKWTKQGTMSNGKLSTHLGLSHKIENGFLLSDTNVEDEQDEYFH